MTSGPEHQGRALLAVLLLVSAALIFIGITWGLPSGRGWAADEIFPRLIISGLRDWFALGPASVYPPLHYYLLGALYRLIFLFPRIIEPDTFFLFLVNRSLSACMAIGAIIILYQCAKALAGTRAALYAALIAAVNVTFVYYAKLANLDVPYTFWFMLSLFLFLRLRTGGRLRDYVFFAASAAAAVCTKDQAYALYLLPGCAVFLEIMKRKSEAPPIKRFVYTLLSREIVLSLLVAASLFAFIDRLPTNFDGFRGHVAFITGPASKDYRNFDPTIYGELQLLLVSLQNFAFSLGVPLAIVCAAGLRFACGRDERSRALRWILLPAVSYYLFFICMVLYSYDRFLLPVDMILSIFGGVFFDELLSRPTRFFRLRVGAVATLFVYSLCRAVSVDLLMIHDSRYAAARWMLEHMPADSRIALVGPREYLPRIEFANQIELEPSIDLLRMRDFKFLLINGDYGRRFGPERRESVFFSALDRGETDFREIYRSRTPVPIELISPPESSNLAKINPEIVIYERVVK